MLVYQPFAAQPMPWSASLDEPPTEAIQTKQMYRSASRHRIFFTANSDINKIASFCNALKSAYNARGAEFENCAAHIQDDGLFSVRSSGLDGIAVIHRIRKPI